MKNNDNLRGLKSVYSFTLSQTMKSKSNIVSMLILFVMALISLPLQNLTGNSVSISPIQTAYVTNESGTELDFDALTAQNAAFSSVSFAFFLSPDFVYVKRPYSIAAQPWIVATEKPAGKWPAGFRNLFVSYVVLTDFYVDG